MGQIPYVRNSAQTAKHMFKPATIISSHASSPAALTIFSTKNLALGWTFMGSIIK